MKKNIKKPFPVVIIVLSVCAMCNVQCAISSSGYTHFYIANGTNHSMEQSATPSTGGLPQYDLSIPKQSTGKVKFYASQNIYPDCRSYPAKGTLNYTAKLADGKTLAHCSLSYSYYHADGSCYDSSTSFSVKCVSCESGMTCFKASDTKIQFYYAQPPPS